VSTSPQAHAPQPSRGFQALAPQVQRWIWQQQWPALRPAQEAAIAPILTGDRDVVISAATAAGKTEAAFLPICTRLLRDHAAEPHAVAGVNVLYVSPLKALINDQWGRLDELCAHLDIPVHKWHGDVTSGRKAKILKDPSGILIITPEALEAFFVLRGLAVPHLLRALRYVVIDEIHAFLGTPRGAQVASLLHRVELAIRRRAPRIGLSATVGDLKQAQQFLRPNHPEQVVTITDTGPSTDARLQVRGYIRTAPSARTSQDGLDASHLNDPTDVTSIAEHLFATLRGSNNLVFANRRADVELFADRLSRLCQDHGVPAEFFPHHGSLSRELRHDVETRLRDPCRPTTVVCTSTLELGIDIGAMGSVAQLGAPPSVAALRQRLGRSGRRSGEAATMRFYVTEDEIGARSCITDSLRPELVQTIAMVDLALDRWYEPVIDDGLNLSTLIQQVLSLIAQHSGVRPHEAYSALCGPGPFRAVSTVVFAQLLRDMAASDLLMQSGDGLLLAGAPGERLINHYSFYAAFSTSVEYRLIAAGHLLGSMPIAYPLEPGARLIFAGRRWQIIAIDDRQRVIELIQSSGGQPPRFTGTGALISAKVHHRMLACYRGHEVPPYLDNGARHLLQEARDNFRRWRLHLQPVMRSGDELLLYPWRGDRVNATLAILLRREDLDATYQGSAITITDADLPRLEKALHRIVDAPAPEATKLARHVENKAIDKYDDYLSDDLLAATYASRTLDVGGAIDAMRQLLAVLPDEAHLGQLPASPSPTVRQGPASNEANRTPLPLARTIFSVVDVETTGFSPALGHRIVEIAIARTDHTGETLDRFATLLNPGRDIGATDIHGLRAFDVADAPTFRQIADHITSLLQGTVVVAHNAPFDLGFLDAEYARLQLPTPVTASLCTLELALRYSPHLPRHTLTACCAGEGVTMGTAHTATDDADAATALLARYLTKARSSGVATLADLGVANPAGNPNQTPLSEPTTKRRTAAIGPANHTEIALECVVRTLGGQLYEMALRRARSAGPITDAERRELELLAAQWAVPQSERDELWRTLVAG
jgi:ATP-dependent Lhr-like helicase